MMKTKKTIAFVVAFVAFMLEPPSGYGQGDEYFPMWKLNIIQGDPLVVEGEIINRELAEEVSMNLIEPSGVEIVTISEIRIDRVLFGGPSLLFDSRFSECFNGVEITPFTMKIIFRGLKAEASQARNGTIVLHPDILFGRYFYDPLVQIQNFEEIKEALEIRAKIIKVAAKRFDSLP